MVGFSALFGQYLEQNLEIDLGPLELVSSNINLPFKTLMVKPTFQHLQDIFEDKRYVILFLTFNISHDQM